MWGGASAVGQFVIQLAKQSGLQVITTASPQNHELLRKLGADTVFDYRDPKVISNIKTFCGDKQLHVAIDCVSVDESVSLVTQCIEDCEDSYIALVLPVKVKKKYIRSDFTDAYTLLGKVSQMVMFSGGWMKVGQLSSQSRENTPTRLFLNILSLENGVRLC